MCSLLIAGRHNPLCSWTMANGALKYGQKQQTTIHDTCADLHLLWITAETHILGTVQNSMTHRYRGKERAKSWAQAHQNY